MPNPLPAVGLVAGLALIGGLAAACFAKAFGIVFLGEPRTDAARTAHECGWAMRLPMIILAAACILIGFGAPWAVAALKPAIAGLTNVPAAQIFGGAGRSMMLLMELTIGFAAVAGVVVLLGFIRKQLLQNRPVRRSPTWDCGYAAPTPRMQYTASSFALWFVDAFRWILRTERRRSLPQGYFPDAAFMTTETPDGFRELVFRPVFAQMRWALASLRWIQHGRLQLYILYIAATLLALLIWYASCL
jgi:NADH:ubiquinone oxidoreductase subunit 5 (subunit L)/multisubunit Na+/H+ antiporter MnhA subunit